jgi:hypothetical protein
MLEAEALSETICFGVSTSSKEIFKTEANILLFPNPVTDELIVRSSEFGDINEIIIYNPLGEKVFQSHVSNLTSQISVDVSQLPSGIYFIRVKTDKGIGVGKFVKD